MWSYNNFLLYDTPSSKLPERKNKRIPVKRTRTLSGKRARFWTHDFEPPSIWQRIKVFIRLEIGDALATNPILNHNWTWGSLSGIFLMIQIITGLFMSMQYSPETETAFDSILRAMNDVSRGWVLRYMHSNGASFFFFCMYMHIAKNIYYKLYLNNMYAWFSGLFIFIFSMATAFVGYVLPWGQMSYWGATVITSLFSSFPVIGEDFVKWVWGGFSIADPTIHRFYSLHFVLPFIILAFVGIHLFFLHKGNSSSNLTMRLPDKTSFYPYFFLKDGVGVISILIIYFLMLLYHSNYLGHSDNSIDANPLVTPNHIVPEWYFLPFYAILRAVPDKFAGTILMMFSIGILFLLPVCDSAKLEQNANYFYFYGLFFWSFAFNFVLLGWLGAKTVESPYYEITVFCTFVYFSYFFILTVRKIYLIYKLYSQNVVSLKKNNQFDEKGSLLFSFSFLFEDYLFRDIITFCFKIFKIKFFYFILIVGFTLFLGGILKIFFTNGNLLLIMLSIEMMMFGLVILFISSFSFIAFLDPFYYTVVFVILTLVVSESVIGLVLIILISKLFGSVNTYKLNKLRG